MKKIIILVSITLLFSSCSLFNKGEDENMGEKENPIEIDGDLVNDNDGDEVDVSTETGSTETGSTETGSTEGKKDIKEIIGDSKMEDVDTTKTDDEIVKEFENELDSLFKLLEGNE